MKLELLLGHFMGERVLEGSVQPCPPIPVSLKDVVQSYVSPLGNMHGSYKNTIQKPKLDNGAVLKCHNRKVSANVHYVHEKPTVHDLKILFACFPKNKY